MSVDRQDHDRQDGDARCDEQEDLQVRRAIDAVDQMMEVVDGFEAYVVHAADREVHSTRYRLNLLWLHSAAALMIAPLLSLTGRDGLTGPSFAALRAIPAAPYSLSTLLGVGGFILGWGCIFRAKRTEIAGLALLGAFYLLMAVSFTIPPVGWLLHHHGPKPPMYSAVVYLHLTTIMLVHQWALVIRLRDERAAAAAYAAAAERDGDG